MHWEPKPWVGARYGETRCLVLGEASYAAEAGIRGDRIRTRSHDQIEWFVTFGDAVPGEKTPPFERTVTEQLKGNKLKPKAERSDDRAKIWQNCAFCNYISDRYVVPRPDSTRPTREDWTSAAVAFGALVDALRPKPERVAIFGKATWDQFNQNHAASIARKGVDPIIVSLQGHIMLVTWANHPNAQITSEQRMADGAKIRMFLRLETH